MQKEQEKQQQKTLTINQIKSNWDKFAPTYDFTDSTTLTFYYTLINMLNIQHAQNILQIGAGIGKLLPHALNLKPKQSTYFATDISSVILNLGKAYLSRYLQKIGVEVGVDEWCQSQNLTFGVMNGEEPIEKLAKYDRIICNLVLMITEDPEKMLNNLFKVSSDDCLLGVTVWGSKAESNMLTLADEARKQLGLPIVNVRNSFHLYNKLDALVEKTNWEIVVIWQQNSPFNFYELDEHLKYIISCWNNGNEQIVNYSLEKIKETFESKKILNFPTQMAILKKKK